MIDLLGHGYFMIFYLGGRWWGYEIYTAQCCALVRTSYNFYVFFILDQYQLGPLKKTPNDPPVAMDRLQYFKPRRWMIQAASFTLAYWKELFHVVSRLV